MSHGLRTLLESAGAPHTVTEFPRDAVLFRQGDTCVDAWWVESGSVRLAITSPDGREAIPGLLRDGSFVNDGLLAGHREFRHSAVAITPTVVLRVPGDQMTELVRTRPAIRDYVLGQVMTRHLQLENALIDQLLCSSEERLAHTLLILAECDLAECDKSAGRCHLPHVSQEVIAEMVGTTRSRVNVFMGRFKKAGFIETSNREMYVNSSRLSQAVHHHT